MNGQEGLTAGRRAAVDGDVDEYFLDLSHRRATGERASDGHGSAGGQRPAFTAAYSASAYAVSAGFSLTPIRQVPPG